MRETEDRAVCIEWERSKVIWVESVMEGEQTLQDGGGAYR